MDDLRRVEETALVFARHAAKSTRRRQRARVPKLRGLSRRAKAWQKKLRENPALWDRPGVERAVERLFAEGRRRGIMLAWDEYVIGQEWRGALERHPIPRRNVD